MATWALAASIAALALSLAWLIAWLRSLFKSLLDRLLVSDFPQAIDSSDAATTTMARLMQDFMDASKEQMDGYSSYHDSRIHNG